MFIKNCWYVGAWSHEIGSDEPVGREIIGEPIVLYRGPDGAIRALEDRCPHRWAPLSLGRIEGDRLRCMYHGLQFASDGTCVHVPGATSIPPNCRARSFPVIERDSWIWVWMGAPELADESLLPTAFGIDDPRWTMRANQMDYDANYMLINDNLCDLSHVDFVHERTLGEATGYGWSDDVPRVRQMDRGIRVERWLVARPASPTNPTLVDTWSTYDYLAPGIFIMENRSYLHGMAERTGGAAPAEKPMTYRVEQQAVTPIDARRTRYFYASGFDAKNLPERLVEGIFEVVMSAFTEDKAMIEAQQRVWDRTPDGRQMAFIAHDKAPSMFRRTIARLLKAEGAGAEAGSAA